VLDDMDKRIVRVLQKNARTPNTEIARALGVTETTIRNRVARLLDEKQIGVVAVVNPEATEATISAFLEIGLHPKNLDAVVEKLRARGEVRYLGLTLGRAQIIIEAFFRDHEHLLAFQTGVVATLPGVTAVETAIVVRVAKFSYEWEI
jgi:Lrp/AsnC family transcriptional regulator, regulator for asnA, asnC and gidA